MKSDIERQLENPATVVQHAKGDAPAVHLIPHQVLCRPSRSNYLHTGGMYLADFQSAIPDTTMFSAVRVGDLCLVNVANNIPLNQILDELGTRDPDRLRCDWSPIEL